jgi:hypothetical protein
MHFYRPIVPLRTISSAVWSGTKIHIFVLHGFLSIWLGGRLELFVHYLLDTHRSVCCWEGYVMADCCIVVPSHKLDMLFIVEVQQGNDNMLFWLLHLLTQSLHSNYGLSPFALHWHTFVHFQTRMVEAQVFMGLVVACGSFWSQECENFCCVLVEWTDTNVYKSALKVLWQQSLPMNSCKENMLWNSCSNNCFFCGKVLLWC